MDPSIRRVPGGRTCPGGLRACIAWYGISKKREKAEESNSSNQDNSAVTTNDIVLAALERGLTMADVRRMQVGQVVDFCIAYNDRVKASEKEEKKRHKRKANQNDINAFFG